MLWGVSSSKEKETANPRLINAAIRVAGYIKVSELEIECIYRQRFIPSCLIDSSVGVLAEHIVQVYYVAIP